VPLSAFGAQTGLTIDFVRYREILDERRIRRTGPTRHIHPQYVIQYFPGGKNAIPVACGAFHTGIFFRKAKYLSLW